MNLGLSDVLKTAFPDITPVVRPLVVDQEIKDPNWLAGFSFFFFAIFSSIFFPTVFPVGENKGKKTAAGRKKVQKKKWRGVLLNKYF